MKDSIKDFIQHPATVLSAGLASLSSLFSIPFVDPMLGVVWGNIGQLFTAFSISAFTIVPNIDLPVAEVGQSIQIIAILLGVAYAGKLGYGVLQQVLAKSD